MNENSGQPLLVDSLIDFCQSDSLSEEGVREIVERRLSKPNDAWARFALHLACLNERVTEAIVQCLLEYFPDAASDTGCEGLVAVPLHCACSNRSVTLNIIQLLIDAYPDAVRSLSDNGRMPLHALCMNKKVDEATAKQILRLLIEKCPEAVRHADSHGYLPIHLGASRGRRSPDFCRVLIEAYPGSERMGTSADGALPLHLACKNNSLATVEHLYRQYPEAIHHADAWGYPIHYAITGAKHRVNPATAVEIVQFLLDCDPDVKLQKSRLGRPMLRVACGREYNDASIEAGMQMIKILFDAHPEAIEHRIITSNIQRYRQQVQTFINNELVYARQAKDHSMMTTPDDNGQLPLHVALQNKAMLGSIKLLVKGNPDALQSPDNSGALPLHIACQHQDSTNVLEYLVELDTATLGVADRNGNTALHYACRASKYETIALLLKKYDAVSVSKRNAQDKLPIELLWQSNAVKDKESVEYTESVFRLLKAHPEMIMCSSMNLNEPTDMDATQVDKKRKFCDGEEE